MVNVATCSLLYDSAASVTKWVDNLEGWLLEPPFGSKTEMLVPFASLVSIHYLRLRAELLA